MGSGPAIAAHEVRHSRTREPEDLVAWNLPRRSPKHLRRFLDEFVFRFDDPKCRASTRGHPQAGDDLRAGRDMTLVERFIEFNDWPTSRKTALLSGLTIPAHLFANVVVDTLAAQRPWINLPLVDLIVWPWLGSIAFC